MKTCPRNHKNAKKAEYWRKQCVIPRRSPQKNVKVQVLQKTFIQKISLFRAQPIDIKKRIESLIEREYLERDSKNKAKYIYKP